jgi:hypothetical protein
VDVLLFVPSLTRVQLNTLSKGTSTIFKLSGERLFPCGLKIRFCQEGGEESPSQQYDLTIIDEMTVKVTLANSLSQEKGNYFGFNTNSILLVKDHHK